MAIFRKNKRQFGHRSHRNLFVALFLFLVFSASGIVSLILCVKAQMAPVPSVEIQSEQTSFEDGEPGAWKITKSAEWLNTSRARITFTAESVELRSEKNKRDVLLVVDNSGSMKGIKLTRVKEDATELVDELLSDEDNRVALVTFSSDARIISGFTNNKVEMLEYIDNIGVGGETNYNEGYKKALDVLDGYVQPDDTDLIMLFLTDGLPNNDVPNEIAQYRTMKILYPDMVINGIQYEMGDTVLQPIIDVTDNQFIASMDNLYNVLIEASINVFNYGSFVITDYINSDYWDVVDVDSIKASIGQAALTYDGSVAVVTWDMSGKYRSGTTRTLTIDIDLKDEFFDQDLLLPTNKHETIVSSIKNAPEEDVDSNLTPVLKNAFNVIYNANPPSGCEVSGVVPDIEAHTVTTTVGVHQNELSCPGYGFKGWRADIDMSYFINEDYFRMPERDVTFKAVWMKLDITKSMSGRVGASMVIPATFDTGSVVSEKLKKLSGDWSSSSTTNTAITAIKEARDLPDSIDTMNSENIISASDSVEPIYAWYEEGIIYYFTYANTLYLNEDASRMFNGMANLALIDGIRDWVTSNTTNMSYMFGGASKNVTDFILNLSEWDVSNVTNMTSMFSNAADSVTGNVIIDLSGWDTSNVTAMNSMFYSVGAKAANVQLDISGWDTSNVTNMSYMFRSTGSNAAAWSVIGLSDLDTSSVTNMSDMFTYFGAGTATFELDLSSWNVSNVTTMANMFSNVGDSATDFSLNLSGWSPSSATNMYCMFHAAARYATTFDLDLSGWDTSSVNTFTSMFEYAALYSTTFALDLTGWNTSSATSLYSMFREAGRNATTWSITGLSGWDTSNVTMMGDVFNEAGYNATTFALDLTGWDAPKATSLSNMFRSAGCNATTWSITGLSGWNAPKITSLDRMFYQAGWHATSFVLDMSDWNTPSLTSLNSMFYFAGFDATTFEVDLSGLDVSNVTNMAKLFQTAGHNATDWSVSGLEDWDVSSVTDMTEMFYSAAYSAADLTLDLSGWDVSSVTDMSSMFQSAGYAATNIDLDLSGWNTSNVTKFYAMFSTAGRNATGSFKVDVSGWDLSSTTHLNNMFNYAGYTAATWEVTGLSTWDTSNVQYVGTMFNYAGYNATSFVLDLSTWNTANVLNMYNMFYSAGYKATTWSITIPRTNGGGITNTTSKFYGKTTSTNCAPPNKRSFTLATS